MLIYVWLWGWGVQAQLEAHVQYLASDSLKGRPYPSVQLDQAADYIVERFKEMGIQPLESGYFQKGPDQLTNVVAWIPGTQSEVIVLSAHYDHIGMAKSGPDLIFNGANDNASGVAVMLEVARILKARPTPKYTILFTAFSGEEAGMLGSRYFVNHPPITLERIRFQLNLEQVGRWDELDPAPNQPPKAVSLTGFTYTDAESVMGPLAKANGLTLIGHPVNSQRYFTRSDNASFAFAGIPCHTLSACYAFPDYHGVDDEWEKLDFAFMAQIVTMVAESIQTWAESGQTPVWNPIPQTEPFRRAQP
ncbi:MAG: M20/M25/M40 family metallo-hydrolase [Acidobacteria bacterium]|nr:M20/M25/M40 family metallo-hydrolase [Acidobacteriota bacterium]MCB9397727.1 M20/M25/M40 family metallo-hydrolase [Acidobacteriota bacterium]